MSKPPITTNKQNPKKPDLKITADHDSLFFFFFFPFGTTVQSWLTFILSILLFRMLEKSMGSVGSTRKENQTTGNEVLI